jgi:FtsP/CotA-like multicopper oxidase with cupredoxin domain
MYFFFEKKFGSGQPPCTRCRELDSSSEAQEWTVRNVSGEHHVFHIHQTDFLVIDSNDETRDIGQMMDSVNVPHARNGRAGEVRLMMPFLKDRIADRFV